GARMLEETFFFFFSSRRRHTIFSRDWSSDVCSSDLISYGAMGREKKAQQSIQDQNAMELEEAVAVQRAVSKSSQLYKNSQWDLEIGRASCREREWSAERAECSKTQETERENEAQAP